MAEDKKTLPDPTSNNSNQQEKHNSQDDTLSDMDKVRAKRALILLGIITLGLLLIWNQHTTTVNSTALRPGVYLGSVQAGNLATFEIFAEKDPNSDTVKIVPFNPEWPVQEVHSDAVREIPMSLSSASTQIDLVIDSSSENTFSGPVILSGTTENVGTWQLTSIDSLKFAKQSDIEISAIKRSVGFYADEANILSEIEKHQSEIAVARARLVDVSSGVAASKSEREQELKLAELKSQAAVQEKKLAELTDALTQANDKLNVELKVSKAGKLVQLAREAEAREERWRNSLYRTDPASINPEVFSKLGDATRINELKKLIAAEQVRVFGAAGGQTR